MIQDLLINIERAPLKKDVINEFISIDYPFLILFFFSFSINYKLI